MGMAERIDKADDDSVLDEIGEAVETVLFPDTRGMQPEDPWLRRQRLLDSWTAIVLAVAAVATAWVSFEASQWNDLRSDLQAAATVARTDAARLATDATTAHIVDSQTWLEWVAAVSAGEARQARFLEERFSSPLQVAQRAWLAGSGLDDRGMPDPIPPGTPMDLPVYVVPAQVRSDEETAIAEDLIAEAAQASAISTDFVLLAVVYALVLFFASVATKFSEPRIQVLLTIASVVILAFGLIRLAFLPQLL
jgi:hypothetical protein